MNMWVKKRRGMDPPFHCGLAGGNRHPRSVAASQPCRHIRGDSYRLREKRRAGLLKATAVQQSATAAA
jgi:hypothetical protein